MRGPDPMHPVSAAHTAAPAPRSLPCGACAGCLHAKHRGWALGRAPTSLLAGACRRAACRSSGSCPSKRRGCCPRAACPLEPLCRRLASCSARSHTPPRWLVGMMWAPGGWGCVGCVGAEGEGKRTGSTANWRQCGIVWGAWEGEGKRTGSTANWRQGAPMGWGEARALGGMCAIHACTMRWCVAFSPPSPPPPPISTHQRHVQAECCGVAPTRYAVTGGAEDCGTRVAGAFSTAGRDGKAAAGLLGGL
jgi:hypothetical protein